MYAPGRGVSSAARSSTGPHQPLGKGMRTRSLATDSIRRRYLCSKTRVIGLCSGLTTLTNMVPSAASV